MTRETYPADAASPSAWSRRLPVAVLAAAGCGIATYLTLYQWHVLGSAWDPVFGARSSEDVLMSSLSRSLPLPDATLGAIAYLVEAGVTCLGSAERYRAAPWAVLLFGAVVVALALTSLVLILIQALVVQRFCSLCLVSASISFLNAWLARDEVSATLRAVLRVGPDRQLLGRVLHGERRSA